MARSKYNIVFPFTPQETQSMATMAMSPYAKKKINGYGGPKFGGKSWEIIYLAALHAMSRPVKIIIIGHKFEDMKSLHIEPMERWLDDYIKAGIVKKYHSGNKEITVPQWNSVIKFQQVTNDSDARSLNGQAWDIVLIDEAQKQSPFTLSYLQGICRISHTQSRWRERLRGEYKAAKKEKNYQKMAQLKELWENTYYWPKMLYCFNWGEKGHSILKRWFWDGCAHSADPVQRLDKFRRNDDTGEWEEDPEDYHFIFAPMEKNVKGMAEDPGYVKRIRSMEEPYRTAYLTGDPNAFAGLKYEIHPHIHEVDMDQVLRNLGHVDERGTYIPANWALIGAIDPGTQDFCAAALYAKTPDGTSFQLTDYYFNKRNHETNAEQIFYEWKRCEWTRGRMPDYVVAGKDAFARQSLNAIHGHEVTLADVFWEKYRLHLVEAITDRIAGAQALHMVLHYELNDKGELIRRPRLFFAKKFEGKKDANGFRVFRRLCEATIEELVTLEAHPKRVEDIKQEGVADHAFDRTKYYLLSMQAPPQIPEDRKQDNIRRGYGHHKEDRHDAEEAEYEDISSYGGGSIAGYNN